MITESILTLFYNALNSVINLIPTIPSAPNFNDSLIISTIETAGYLLPIKAMIATFALSIAIKNWQLFVNMVSWVWEKIPFN